MNTIRDIQPDVAKWARDNFGQNPTRYLEAGISTLPENFGAPVACLGAIAPLLGMAEELGELCDNGTTADAIDAIGDMGIFLLDYLSRHGQPVPVPRQPVADFTADPMYGVAASLGRVFHCELKRHQGIRGMDKPATFYGAMTAAVAELLWCLDYLARTAFNLSLDTIVTATWAKVSKRDWTASPTDGGADAGK
jgi:hypothetical protein